MSKEFIHENIKEYITIEDGVKTRKEQIEEAAKTSEWGRYPEAREAWEEGAEFADANPIKKIYTSDRAGLLATISELEAKLATCQRDREIAVSALEVMCGDRCHPEHNPCAAREALDEIRGESET